MTLSITQAKEALSIAQNEISELCAAAGTAGLSVGVLHQGETIHRSNYGVKNLKTAEAPDSDTVYHIASLSKFFTAAAVAVLVDQGRLQWDSLLKDVLPGFHQRDECIESKATLTDALSHRTGLANRFNYWGLMEQELLLPPEETLNVLGALQKAAEFRSTIKYNNWAYASLALMIEKMSGQSLEEFMREKFFEPLGLQRTTFGVPKTENCTSYHMTLSDGTPCEVPDPEISTGTLMTGSAGLKTTINESLRIYDSVLSALQDQTKSGLTSTPNNPFKQAKIMFTGHNRADKTEYGFGWILTQLPSEIGFVSNNSYVVQPPIIGHGLPPTRIAYHNGSMSGLSSSVHTIPETRTVIVVLCNTTAFAELPDYVGGLILNTLLGVKEKVDFLALIAKCKESSIQGPLNAAKQLKAERKAGTSHKPLEEYEGRYANAQGNWVIGIQRDEGEGLRMTVNDKPRTVLRLCHYHDDVFYWEVDRDAQARRAMYPEASADFHKISFRCAEDGVVFGLHWFYSFDEPNGEVFVDGNKKQRSSS